MNKPWSRYFHGPDVPFEMLTALPLNTAAWTAIARRDRNNNIMLDKASRRTQIIDPLVAAVIAVHTWGGKQASCYESEV
jgi:hypothetical protein